MNITIRKFYEADGWGSGETLSVEKEQEDKLWYEIKGLMVASMDKNVTPEECINLIKHLGYKISRENKSEKEQSKVLYQWVKASDEVPKSWHLIPVRFIHTYMPLLNVESWLSENTLQEIEWLKPVQSEIELLKNRIAELESQNKKAISEDELNSIKQKSFNEGHSKGYQLANSDNDFED